MIAPCFLVCDAPLLSFADDAPPGPESDLDALDVDIAAYGCPPAKDYVYSEWAFSPLIHVTATDTTLFPDPGLSIGDELDAINVESESCMAFSLGPGSPTLSAFGFHPGDVLCAGAGGPPLLFLDFLLDLCLCPEGDPDCPDDNLDALWFVDPGKRMGMSIIEEWFPVGISADTIRVYENAPVMWINKVDPQQPSERCPAIVEVEGQQLFIEPGASAAIHGLPAGGLRGGPATYPFTVTNAVDPADTTSGVIEVIGPDPTGVEVDFPGLGGLTPSGLRFVSVQPNPVRSSTSIVFDVPRPTRVTLSLYDVSGRLVRSFGEREWQAGRHQLAWDGTDDRSRRVSAGRYFLRMEGGGESDVRSLTVLR